MNALPWPQIYGFLSFFLPWAGRDAKRWMRPWALISLIALVRALTTESRLEAGTAFVLAFASLLIGSGRPFQPGWPLLLALPALGLGGGLLHLPWLPLLTLLLPLYWLLSEEGPDWGRPGWFWPCLSIQAWLFWREGGAAAPLLPWLLVISALSFRKAALRFPLPVLLWALSCLSLYPERAWILLPLFGALPWQGGPAEGSGRSGRLALAAALALPLTGFFPPTGASAWALWFLAALSLLLSPESKAAWSPAALMALFLSISGWFWNGLGWLSWPQGRPEESGPLPSDPPALPAGMALLPVLILSAAWLAEKAWRWRRKRASGPGPWEGAGSLAAGAACLFLSGRLAGSVGGLYQGREGGGPLVLSLDSLALLLGGLAYSAQALEDRKPELVQGLALALLFLAPDLPSALVGLLVLSSPFHAGKPAAPAWTGWPAALLGAALMAKAWGGWALPDLSAAGASEVYNPLAALGFGLLAGGAALACGLLRGRAELAPLALALLWLLRLASRLPQESAPVLAVLGILVLFQGRDEKGLVRLRRGFLAGGLLLVALALRRGSAEGSLAGLILLSLWALAAGAAAAPGRLAWFPALAAGLALFFPHAALEFLRPAAEFLSSS